MKRLLHISAILICILCFSEMQEVTAQTITPKMGLYSEINEYEVGVVRSNATLAQQSYNEAMVIINAEVASVTQQLQNSTNQTQINTLTARLQAEQQIRTDLQNLQSNLTANFTQIKAKLNSFVALMDN